MRRIVVLCCVLAMGLVGCSKIADKVAETAVEKAAGAAAGGNVDINTDNGEFHIESSEGSLSVGGTLPESFPDEMPLIDHDKVISSMEDTTGSGPSVLTSVQASSSYDDAVAFFEDAFGSGDWTIDGRTQQSNDTSAMTRWQVTGSTVRGAVTVMRSDEGVVVTYAIFPPEDESS